MKGFSEVNDIQESWYVLDLTPSVIRLIVALSNCESAFSEDILVCTKDFFKMRFLKRLSSILFWTFTATGIKPVHRYLFCWSGLLSSELV